MKDDNPLISVIIPVYNGERYLAEAIESVLAQGYTLLEVILIDDGSADQSAAVARQYKEVQYFYQPNSGLSAALNHGISQATGRFFAFLDADDLWVENKISLQMAAFDKDHDLEAVFGQHIRFYTRESGASDMGTKKVFDDKILPALFKGAMLIKRESFFRVGLFDTALTLGDFVDWYKRASEVHLKTLILPDVVLKRRIHDDNQSLRDKHAVKDYVHIMKAALDRQRNSKPRTDE
jgi:glycosyltransferase involved in cell wall biosynthesis